jgi:hypothetical protein
VGWKESFTWRADLYACFESIYPRQFNAEEYSSSFLWGSSFILRSAFLILHAWGKPLSQEQLVSALGGKRHTSVLPSLASNLEAGRRSGLFTKKGARKEAKFQIADNFESSKHFKQVSFIPTEEAKQAVQRRARLLKQKRQQETTEYQSPFLAKRLSSDTAS